MDIKMNTFKVTLLFIFLFFLSTQAFSADDNVSGGSNITKSDLEKKGYKCSLAGIKFFVCEKGGITYWCSSGNCVKMKKDELIIDPNLGYKIVTIRQKSTMRYLDAHEISSKDYRLVTRPKQNNKTQQWRITPLGSNVFTIRQESNKRFVDAYDYDGKDYGLVTRNNQNNDTQRWIIKSVGNSQFTIQQKSNGRYMDAHVTNGRDYEVVTRTFQNNNTQRWIIKRVHQVNSPN